MGVDGAEPVGPFPPASLATSRLAPLEVTGRLLRPDVAESTGGDVGAVEIRADAPPS